MYLCIYMYKYNNRLQSLYHINPKNNKKVWAVAAMGTCYNESTNVKKDKVLMLARKDLIKFIKKATEGTAKFIQ